MTQVARQQTCSDGLLTEQEFMVPICTSEPEENASLAEACCPGHTGHRMPVFRTSDPEADETLVLSPWLTDLLPAFRRLVNYPHNWDSYGSPPPSCDLVWQILPLLQEMARRLNTPIPNVVPMPGGGIQLEWHTRSRELEVEFHEDGSAAFLAVDLKRKSEWEDTFVTRDYGQMRDLLAWLVGND